jgi:hypothetical protein
MLIGLQMDINNKVLDFHAIPPSRLRMIIKESTNENELHQSAQKICQSTPPNFNSPYLALYFPNICVLKYTTFYSSNNELEFTWIPYIILGEVRTDTYFNFASFTVSHIPAPIDNSGYILEVGSVSYNWSTSVQ